MTGRLRIRAARAADVATIHAALQALAAGMGSPAKVTSSPDDIRKHGFGERPAFEVLIAEVDDGFVGFCLTFPTFSTWRGEPGIYVQDLFVDVAFRGHRIGERLLKEVARRGRAGGARHLRLSVDIDNTRAQAFYDRLGLRHCCDEQIHMITGADFDAFAQTGLEHP
ncbi:MAG: GNAT family N-acetyltransferase [Azospirillaceae bacterium]|nr:GNAT family N-acetyltransferase [Azospirillaceae bacterium]